MKDRKKGAEIKADAVLKINEAIDRSGELARDEWSRLRSQLVSEIKSEVYGTTPPPPEYVVGEVLHFDCAAYGGKCSYSRVQLSAKSEACTYSFPIQLLYPSGAQGLPFIVFLSESKHLTNKYLPAAELVDRGFGIAFLCVDDILSPNKVKRSIGAFSGKLYSRRYTWGIISVWSWALSCVADYIYTKARPDTERLSVAGHGVLGAAALLAAADDTRFKFVLSSNSDIFGDSLMNKMPQDELADIARSSGGLIARDAAKRIKRGDGLPIDQNWLLAAIAPRRICISASADGAHSNPSLRRECVEAASRVYSALGLRGYLPSDDEARLDGDIVLSLKGGSPFLSRDDWKLFTSLVQDKK